MKSAGAVFCTVVVGGSKVRNNVRNLSRLLIPGCFQILPFPDLHTVFSLAFLSGLFWHIITLPSPNLVTKISILVGSSLWVASSIIRYTRIVLWGCSAKITSMTVVQDWIRIRVSTRYPIFIVPGSYIHAYSHRGLTFTSLSSGHPLMIISEDSSSEWTTKGVRDFSFVLLNKSKLSKKLKQGQRLIIDGPYGVNTHLEKYENLFLAAEGVGIIGALNTALFISARKRSDKEARESRSNRGSSQVRSKNEENHETYEMQDLKTTKPKTSKPFSPKKLHRDLTRRIDLYWAMGTNNQEELVVESIRNIQRLDQDNVRNHDFDFFRSLYMYSIQCSMLNSPSFIYAAFILPKQTSQNGHSSSLPISCTAIIASKTMRT
jgi:hypothetical protein